MRGILRSVGVMDKESRHTYTMAAQDWIPLIDAMAYLKHIPQCGDVAARLHEIFTEAKNGKYYFIEMGYEGQDGKCFVLGHEFDPNPKKENEQ
jgi:hypothetical protein